MAERTNAAPLKITRRAAAAGLLSLLTVAQTKLAIGATQSPAAPLVVAGARMAVELAPIHIALRNLYGEGAHTVHGGVANLVGKDRTADVASNGETQMLRHSLKEPGMRALMTVAEGYYPIIARRSAGIASLADLKGKRILNYRQTTAGYFLHKMLKTVGLTLDDVTIVQVPLGEVAKVVANREVDAIAIWEPDSEQALRALRAIGEDVVIFSGDGIYHERYNLCTTAGALADPKMRRRIVTFMRAIINAAGAINSDPKVAAQAQLMVAQSGGLYTVEEVAACWPNVHFVAAFDERLLDVFQEEEVWLAGEEKRRPRSRRELGRLIDRSAYDQAKAVPG